MDFYEMRGAYLRATQEDILHRIRFLGEALATNTNMANDCFDAADEIEDLRAELAECQRQYQKLNKKYTDDRL